jgi:AraC family transcriptional regulator
MSPRTSKEARVDQEEARHGTEEAALIHAHLAAIAWIESHLFEPMTVKSIADRAGYSASRFSRGFTRLQGESVMSYVRGRRLEAAMGRLLADPDTRIVDLAFDSGFDSQEAFTRAFVRAFGHPPGRWRGLGAVRSMVRRRKAAASEPEIHERIERTPELHLAGLALRITPANGHEMPAAWQRLDGLRQAAGALDTSTYSVCRNFSPADRGVEMFVALRIGADGLAPVPLQRRSLPAATCAVFRHVVRKGDVFPQISAARELIHSRLLSRSSLSHQDFSAFEVFPRGLHVVAGSWIDYYFPLKE